MPAAHHTTFWAFAGARSSWPSVSENSSYSQQSSFFFAGRSCRALDPVFQYFDLLILILIRRVELRPTTSHRDPTGVVLACRACGFIPFYLLPSRGLSPCHTISCSHLFGRHTPAPPRRSHACNNAILALASLDHAPPACTSGDSPPIWRRRRSRLRLQFRLHFRLRL